MQKTELTVIEGRPVLVSGNKVYFAANSQKGSPSSEVGTIKKGGIIKFRRSKTGLTPDHKQKIQEAYNAL